MDKISIEVAYATPKKQLILAVTIVAGDTVQQAINASKIINQFPEIDLLKITVGVFGKPCQLDKVLEHGERVEIYRPLLQDPMDARRKRAIKTA